MINFPIHNYPKDQVIFKEGTTGNVAFIIKEGTAEISIEGESGKLILAELHPGDIFGEMALFLKENKRTATAVALEDCELIAIYKNFFMDYLKECPAVVVTLINSLIQRLQETSIRLSQSKSLVIEID
ncbi:MAG TPA: cyclic nucleotide-binding protein, partial [Firmicutes bacterium]|nr:cyclic nucleotide-binding protein [Bacillota bacterium]